MSKKQREAARGWPLGKASGKGRDVVNAVTNAAIKYAEDPCTETYEHMVAAQIRARDYIADLERRAGVGGE